jgi:toxin ParE1/3/4
VDLKLFWTDTARYQLADIFDYYKTKVSINTAKKIVSQIVDKSTILEKAPNIGQPEELLKDRKHEYRYLIEGNYKIIYFTTGNLIYIASVFDCRQNPIKIKKV